MARKLLLVLMMAVGAIGSIGALTLKIGTIAPAGSPWDASLHELAAQWSDDSDGAVTLRVYPGGVAGDEPDLIRKMRIGQLQGAALTQLALGMIVPDILALDVPFLMTNDGEFHYVLEKMRPYFEQRFERAGYRLLTWSDAGWVHFFARKPLITPEDLRSMRLGVPSGNDELLDVWKSLGFTAYAFPISDILTGLEAGRIDAFYAPPSAAAVFQWFLNAVHMNPMRVAPVIIALVVDERSWEHVPEELRPRLLAAVRAGEGALAEQTVTMDQDAIRAMQGYGLTIDSIPPSAADEWKALGDAGAKPVIGKLFSREAYDLVLRYLAEYRSVHPPTAP